jgi:hypothetical protein
MTHLREKNALGVFAPHFGAARDIKAVEKAI